MAKFPLLSDSLSNIKEIDLKPIQKQALDGVRIALVGKPGSGRSTLADQMRSDPAREGCRDRCADHHSRPGEGRRRCGGRFDHRRCEGR